MTPAILSGLEAMIGVFIVMVVLFLILASSVYLHDKYPNIPFVCTIPISITFMIIAFISGYSGKSTYQDKPTTCQCKMEK